MRTFWGCLQSDMRRAFLGGGFLVAILLTVLIQLQAVLEELFLSGGSILYYFILTLGTGAMQCLMPAVGTLCFSSGIRRDCESGFSVLTRIRADEGKYLFSKVCACFLSAFFAVVFGMAFFCCILLLCGEPMLSEAALVNMDAYQTLLYGDFLLNDRYMTFLLSIMLTRGFAAGAWALVGLLSATCSNERYAPLVVPFLIAYLGGVALSGVGIRVSPLGLDTGHVSGLSDPNRAFFAVLCCFGGISALSALALILVERRRLRHDGR